MDVLAEIKEEDFTQVGNLQEGFLFGSIKNTGSEIATVNGVSLAVGEAKGYPFIGKGYKEISFDPNGSTLRVLQII